jgi:hypothetical protein
MDAPSSLAIAVYANYERLYLFEQKIGTAKQISWPRRAGVDIRMTGLANKNNAHYYGEIDSTAFLPYEMSGQFDRIPLSVNTGVIAHEHFHAHFQSVVTGPLGRKGDYQSAHPNLGDAGIVNDFTMRGWNEGLADFFASVFTGSADFFSSSLPAISLARRLDGPLREMPDSSQFASSLIANQNNGPALMDFSYQEGTVLARLLYRIAYSGLESPEAFLGQIMARLPNVPNALSFDYNAVALEPDAIVPILLDGLKLNEESCRAVAVTVSAETLQKDFSECSAY